MVAPTNNDVKALILKNLWSSLNPNMRYAAYVLAAFCLWMLSGLLSFGSEEPQKEVEKPRQVRVQVLEKQAFEQTLTLMGQTRANTLATLSAEVDGVIQSLAADNGTPVTKGMSLAQIDLGTRTERLAEAKARLLEAQTLFETDKKLNKEGFRANTQLATAKANLATAKANLAKIEKEITDSSVKSPLTGRVERRHVDVGDYVSMGTPLFDVIDLTTFKLAAYAAQSQRDMLREGATATATTVDGQTLEGTVTFVAKNTEGRTKTYLVEVTVKPEDSTNLSSGMTVEIHIPTQTRPAHFIPHAALVLNDAGDLGVMTAEGGLAKFYSVTSLGDTGNGMWVGGLPDKVELIVMGQATLVDGVTVTEQLDPTAAGDRT